jgi:long-chain acyl-CoA synthetase
MYLTAGLHRSVQKHPDKTATVTGSRRQTFKQLAQRVAQTAGALQALGMQPGERLSVLAQNSDRMMELLLAGWWAGLVVNPINTRWSATEVSYALRDCAASALAVDDALWPVAQSLEADLPALRHRLHMGQVVAPEGYQSLQALVQQAPTVEDVRSAPDTLAAIVYTGGTTGFPKGVMLSHGNFWASLVGRMAEIPNPPEFVTLLTSPMFHVAGLGRMLGQTIVGGTCVTVPVFQPQAVVAKMAEEGVSDLVIVPSMLQMLLETEGFNPQSLPGLQRILWGAAPITVPLLQRAMATFPAVEFIHAYGMTETAASVSVLRLSHTPEFLSSDRIRSAGQAGLSAEIRIADEQGREVPRGTSGEIWIRGPMVMQGYWGRPQETQQAVRQGWLHTGDGGTMDQAGYLYVIDRIKDMVITGGENVYPAEVENVLCSHPAVQACAVIGVPHEKWGEAVHAVVVLRPGTQVTAQALQAHCRSQIGAYKCPKSFEFRDHLPLTAAGKVQKTELRKSVAGQPQP